MNCPFCDGFDSKVVDSRNVDNGHKVKRRRECLCCKKRFNTFEMIEVTPLTVCKKDGSIENFDKEKLIRGIIRASERRPVTKIMIEELVSRIELYLRNNQTSEIGTKFLGELVMNELQDLDEVTYVRFASVYKEFQDLETFQQELMRMKTRKKIL